MFYLRWIYSFVYIFEEMVYLNSLDDSNVITMIYILWCVYDTHLPELYLDTTSTPPNEISTDCYRNTWQQGEEWILSRDNRERGEYYPIMLKIICVCVQCTMTGGQWWRLFLHVNFSSDIDLKLQNYNKVDKFVSVFLCLPTVPLASIFRRIINCFV